MSRGLLTYREYAALPDDGRRYEIHDGELSVTPSPSTTWIDRVRKQELYARHGVPYYWIVDSEACAIEAYVLTSAGYTLAVRATGTEPVSPPPFEGLTLVPAALWPAA